VVASDFTPKEGSNGNEGAIFGGAAGGVGAGGDGTGGGGRGVGLIGKLVGMKNRFGGNLLMVQVGPKSTNLGSAVEITGGFRLFLVGQLAGFSGVFVGITGGKRMSHWP
jgi:hypothetical protein